MTGTYFESLLRWLKEDGHAGCAEDLALAKDKPAVAREVAQHCEDDPYYHDDHARALPGELRAWADEQEQCDA